MARSELCTSGPEMYLLCKRGQLALPSLSRTAERERTVEHELFRLESRVSGEERAADFQWSKALEHTGFIKLRPH